MRYANKYTSKNHLAAFHTHRGKATCEKHRSYLFWAMECMWHFNIDISNVPRIYFKQNSKAML